MTGFIEPVVELYSWHFLRRRISIKNTNPPPSSVEVWKNEHVLTARTDGPVRPAGQRRLHRRRPAHRLRASLQGPGLTLRRSFTEIDFETLDDAAVRRLFVGATRATMKLTLVVSERSAGVLLDRLSKG